MRRPVGVKGIRFGICWSRCFFSAESPLSPPFHPHSLMSALVRSVQVGCCCYGANLLDCRSPFYLCFEHVDNLGAYTASRPETGLLIPSDFVSHAKNVPAKRSKQPRI